MKAIYIRLRWVWRRGKREWGAACRIGRHVNRKSILFQFFPSALLSASRRGNVLNFTRHVSMEDGNCRWWWGGKLSAEHRHSCLCALWIWAQSTHYFMHTYWAVSSQSHPLIRKNGKRSMSPLRQNVTFWLPFIMIISNFGKWCRDISYSRCFLPWRP